MPIASGMNEAIAPRKKLFRNDDALYLLYSFEFIYKY